MAHRQYLAMYLDPDGLPRAWGVATTKVSAAQEAKRQLAIYRDKKLAVDDERLALAEYRLRVKRIPHA